MAIHVFFFLCLVFLVQKSILEQKRRPMMPHIMHASCTRPTAHLPLSPSIACLLVVLLALGADHVNERKRRSIPLCRRAHKSRRHLRARQGPMDKTPHGKLLYVHRATHRRRLLLQRERGRGELINFIVPILK